MHLECVLWTCLILLCHLVAFFYFVIVPVEWANRMHARSLVTHTCARLTLHLHVAECALVCVCSLFEWEEKRSRRYRFINYLNKSTSPYRNTANEIISNQKREMHLVEICRAQKREKNAGISRPLWPKYKNQVEIKWKKCRNRLVADAFAVHFNHTVSARESIFNHLLWLISPRVLLLLCSLFTAFPLAVLNGQA